MDDSSTPQESKGNSNRRIEKFPILDRIPTFFEFLVEQINLIPKHDKMLFCIALC